MMRVASILAVVVSSVALLSGQTSAPERPALAFEVASVRQNTSLNGASSISGPTPGRFTITNTPLGFIMLHAYGARAHELGDVPEWTWTESYDIAATYPEGTAPTDAETRLMLQQLLRERFKLAVRRENRQMPGYRLVLSRSDGRLGPQLVKSETDCEKWLAEKRPQADAGGRSPVAPGGRRPACTMLANRRGYLTGGTRTIAELSNALASFLGRPVIDETGLEGSFDIDLEWTPNGEISAPPAGVQLRSPDGPNLLTAVQEQLGLKLESVVSVFNVIAIERVDRPTSD